MSGPGGNPFSMGGGQGGQGALAFDAGDIPDLGPIAGWLIAGFAVLLALGVAGSLSGAWDTVLLWVHRVPYSPTSSVTDPVFSKDISFYLFDLPFFRFVQSVVNGLLLASLAIAGARYLVAASRGGEVFITRVRVHLALLGGLYLLSVAFGYQLEKLELVYSNAGVATGVAFADENARFLAYDILTYISGIAGALLVAGAFTRWLWPLGMVVIIWFSASIVLGTLYPEAIQRFTVDPNKYAQEQPYIAYNITMTRLAFGLDAWDTPEQYVATAPITAAGIKSEADTFANARLWDYRPLQTTLKQLQTIKQYYDFVDVDTDRYMIDGTLRQVMLSGRELAIAKNPDATSWVNERVIFTHGIGLTMVPVNEVTAEGQPRLWIKDLPPASTAGAPTITQPRIYFGESDNHYVLVGARQAEFDYPVDSGAGADKTTAWSGTTGIPMSSTFNRLLFAARFGDLDMLISDQVTASSQLLFHRTLSDRLGLIAPFLRYDKDPYLVIDDKGKLVYIQDAYTVTDRFPNASSFNTGELGSGSGLASDDVNYIRNSVKITMDAYDGTMHFYVSDPNDPLIRAWEGVFPAMFEPLANVPAGIAAHLRVPEELFDVQTRMYGQYHVKDALTFFNNTDRWTVPASQTNEQSLPSEAYYVVMRMPGATSAEFLLLQPMIAASRPNMIAWVAARNDGADYGKVKVFQFPAGSTVFGPAQIEARIDQDPTISAQITLWNQSGSQVVRGNLIVVPVANSLIYLQPVYLQSTSGALPEFQKIVVGSPTTIAWGNSLAEAPDAGMPTDVTGLVGYANQHYDLAQQALRNGDFATYGTEIAKVKAALAQLTILTASPGASTAP